MCYQLHAQHLPGDLARVLGGLGQLHAATFAATAGRGSAP